MEKTNLYKYHQQNHEEESHGRAQAATVAFALTCGYEGTLHRVSNTVVST